MKFWKEKASGNLEGVSFWKGEFITELSPNEVFVFGSNPEARHFAGAAKSALKFGAIPRSNKTDGIARGLSPNKQTYGIITKNLTAGITVDGILYEKEGYLSVSPEQISDNIDELYLCAKEHSDRRFLITYKYESWPNGSPKKSLNGYTSQEMLEMFAKDKEVPPNIIFHESYKHHLEKLYKNKNKQFNSELVVFEDDEAIDIKEEDIIWTINSDERNPQGINGAGAAKAAMNLSKGAKNGVGRGFNGANAYALVTKSLNAGFVEKATGILYDKEGYCSVSPEQIRANIDEFYEIAKSQEYKNKKFLVSYQYETWPNGSPKKSLNGYTSQEMLEMFVKDKEVPPNIVFHESYKPHLEKLYQSKNKVVVSEENRTYSKPNITNPTNNTPAQSIVGNKVAKDVKVEGNLLVVSPQDNVPEGFNIINTTSRDTEGFGKNFSPFLLKNIPLYDGMIAKNMENAWQYAKVYKDFLDENGNPSVEYFKWAKDGWNNFTAVRYPNGKGAKAEYSYWETKDDKGNLVSHKWDYVTARKNIYIPLYAKAISQTKAFKELQQRYDSGEKIALWDFDGYNHYAKDMSFESVVHDQKRCGHAFVIYGLLKGYLKIINDELVYDFDLKITNPYISEKDNINKSVIPNQLKNLYPCIFEISGVKFISVEHFLSYSKAKIANDLNAVNIAMIINEEPFIQKFLSGEIIPNDIATNKEYYNEWNNIVKTIKCLNDDVKLDKEEWKKTAPNLMRIALKTKLDDNPDIKVIFDEYMNKLSDEEINGSKFNKICYDVFKELKVKRTRRNTL